MNSRKTKTAIIILSSLLVLAIGCSAFLLFRLKAAKEDSVIQKQWHSTAVSPAQAQEDGIYNDEYMRMAIDNAIHNEGIGGPVGAVITKTNGELVVSTSNHNRSGSSMLHGEVCAIYEAQMILGTKDLSDCVLYTSAEPCLMCAASIANAKLSKVYYAADFAGSASYGFDDEGFYNRILSGDTLTEWVHVEEPNWEEPFSSWYQRKQKNGASK